MTSTQRQRSPRRDAPAPNPAPRGVILVVVGVVLAVILLAKGGGVGFESDRTDVEIGGTDRTTTTTEAPTTTVPVREPETVRVVVANGSSVSGLAGRTAQFLAQSRYTTSNATDASQPATQTVVYFAPGFEANARALAELLQLSEDRVQALPGQVGEDQPPDTGVVVLLGPDVPAPVGGTTATTAAGGATGGVTTTTTARSGAAAASSTVAPSTTVRPTTTAAG
jgi:hypothetical protein